MEIRNVDRFVSVRRYKYFNREILRGKCNIYLANRVLLTVCKLELIFQTLLVVQIYWY